MSSWPTPMNYAFKPSVINLVVSLCTAALGKTPFWNKNSQTVNCDDASELA